MDSEDEGGDRSAFKILFGPICGVFYDSQRLLRQVCTAYICFVSTFGEDD